MRSIPSLDVDVVDDAMDATRIADPRAPKTIVFHRDNFEAAKQQPECFHPGIYILIGVTSSVESLYVGKCAEQVRLRLKNHKEKKDFWNHGIVFPLPIGLEDCCIQYLEARVIAVLREKNIIKLENKVIPRIHPIGDIWMKNMDALVLRFLRVLSAVRNLTFVRPGPLIPPKLKWPNGRRKLILSAKGVTAVGYRKNKGITVLRGSQMVVDEVASLWSSQLWVAENRQQLIDQGIVVKVGNIYRFAVQYTFRSPSWAAAAILGRPANGRRDWTDVKGRKLGAFAAPVRRCRQRESRAIFRNGIKK